MIGQRLGKYEVLEEVGQGGMSVVYRGSDDALDREVALKVLHPHLAGREDYRARFHREAKAVARLSHPNIPEIYDFSDDGEDLAYLVTEYIPGPTLRDFVDDHPFDLPAIGVAVAACLANALQHAHDHGVIHRDVKPENVIIAPNGVLKLTDFGIAHVKDTQGLTATGTLLGSPAHMSPEHIEGKPLDPRADIFALGTVLYWMVTGELPFSAPNPQALFRTILDGEFTPAVRERPSVGDAISAVIDKTIAREAGDRYGDAMKLSEALEAVLEGAGLHERSANDIVADWFAAPQDCEANLRGLVVAGLVARGRSLVVAKRKAAAMHCYSRVLALVPDETEAEVQAEIESLVAADRRATWIKRGALATAFGGIVAAGVIFAPPLSTFQRQPLQEIPEEAESAGDVMPGGDPALQGAPGADGRAGRRPKGADRGTTGQRASAPKGPKAAPSTGVARRRTPPKVSRSSVVKPPGEEVRVASATTVGRPPPTNAGPIWLPIKARPYADVFVNGSKVAAHPPDHRIQLIPGRHQVTFKKRGNQDRTFDIDVPADGTGLKPVAFWWPAIVHVTGAKDHIVQVQGKDLGSTNAQREFPMSKEHVPRARVVVLDPKTGPVHEEVVSLRAGGKVVVALPPTR